MDALLLFRRSLNQKPPVVPQLLSNGEEVGGESLVTASHARFGDGTVLPLSTVTRFARPSGPVDLRTVYRAYASRDLSITDYINLCTEDGIPNLTFIERADLLTWLEGASDASDYIPAMETAKPKRERRVVSERMDEIHRGERTMGGRTTALRGIKPTDFSHVRKEAYASFISNLRKKTERQPVSNVVSPNKRGKSRDPIIILSPSASALINLSNVKSFLEGGTFQPPQPSSGTNLVTISRNSARLGPLRFIVVDSVDRFKPDYWDRVVAVFTTGQAWQFKEYKWSNPKELFQRLKGFVVTYVGDPQPAPTLEWNVDLVKVERVRRHTDREVVEAMIWEKLEKFMEGRGWARR